jgi:hypothetical protein
MDVQADREIEAYDCELLPLAEIGRALINISEGADFWGALAQATANVANHEGNDLRQRLRYSRLCTFCDWMYGRPWRRLVAA